jgi:hypothetical protein
MGMGAATAARSAEPVKWVVGREHQQIIQSNSRLTHKKQKPFVSDAQMPYGMSWICQDILLCCL